MEINDFNNALKHDIEYLKNTSLEVVPARTFYRNILFILIGLYIFMVILPWCFTILIKLDDLSTSFYKTDFFLMSMIFGVCSLFILPKVAEFVTFKETLMPGLLFGNSIYLRLKFYFAIVISVYLCWSIFYTQFCFSNVFSHVGERAFSIIPGLILGYFIASVLFQLEVARVGLSSLFEIIATLKEKRPTVLE